MSLLTDLARFMFYLLNPKFWWEIYKTLCHKEYIDYRPPQVRYHDSDKDL